MQVNKVKSLYILRDQETVADELIRFVDEFEIVYSWDVNGNLSIERRGVPANDTDWSNVLSVNISLTIKSDGNVQSDGSQLVRQYTRTANIRNRSI